MPGLPRREVVTGSSNYRLHCFIVRNTIGSRASSAECSMLFRLAQRERAGLVAGHRVRPRSGPDDASEFLFHLIRSVMTAPNGGRNLRRLPGIGLPQIDQLW